MIERVAPTAFPGRDVRLKSQSSCAIASIQNEVVEQDERGLNLDQAWGVF